MQLDLILLNFLPQSLVWPAWSIGTLPWKTRLESTDPHPVVLAAARHFNLYDRLAQPAPIPVVPTASMVGMAGSSRDPDPSAPPSTPVRGAWSSARRSRRNDAQRSSSRSLTGLVQRRRSPLGDHAALRSLAS